MDIPQFLSVARRQAANIKDIFALSFQLDLLTDGVNWHKKKILQEQRRKEPLFDTYKRYCLLIAANDWYQINCIICAYVELENEAEKKSIFEASEQNAKNPQPLPGDNSNNKF